MSRLEVTGLRKSFGNKLVLDNLSFSCKTGEIIGIFGRNGSGKSTLLKTILGSQKADFVNIAIDGRAIKASEVIPSREIGFLPQDSFLPKEKKVRDVIPLVFPKGEAQDRIFYSEGVAKFDSKKVGKLSAGQLKYLELLLLCHLQHPFLFLDEPFSMLEPHYIERIKKLLLSLNATKGLVITDHYYADVLEIATRSFIIKNEKTYVVKNEQDLMKHEYLKAKTE